MTLFTIGQETIEGSDTFEITFTLTKNCEVAVSVFLNNAFLKWITWRPWTLLVITKNTYYHKTFLDYELWEEVDSIKHCEKRLPLKWHVFEKEVIFHEFDFETSDLTFEVSKSSIWKHTTSCDRGATRVFCSFINISQLQHVQLKFSQVCYFVHMLRYTNCED